MFRTMCLKCEKSEPSNGHGKTTRVEMRANEEEVCAEWTLCKVVKAAKANDKSATMIFQVKPNG